MRDVATHLEAADASVLGVRGEPHPFEASARPVDVLPVYPGRGSFAPTLANNARALLHLAGDFRSDLWHFVFAPSPRTTSILKKLRWVRRTPSLQTIASPPKDFTRARELVFGDRIVVQSAWTRARLLEHAPELRIDTILPSAPRVEPPEPAAVAALRKRLELEEQDELLVYPGDLEFSRGAEYFAELIETLSQERKRAVFVYACRAKTPAAAQVEARLRERLSGKPVRFTGELDSLLPLLAAATLVVFPTDSAFGKVDIPIALLEAMRLGVPVTSFDFGPLVELEGTAKVPLGDRAALLERVRSLLDHPEERSAVSEAQRSFLESQLDPRANARRYEQIYREMVEVG